MNEKNHHPGMHHPIRAGRSLYRACNILPEILFGGWTPSEINRLFQGTQQPVNGFSYEKDAVIWQQACGDNAIGTLRRGLVKRMRCQSRAYQPPHETAVFKCFQTRVFYPVPIMNYNARGES